MNVALMKVTRDRVPVSSGTSGSRVNEIDLLRFGAAIAVVLFHYSFRYLLVLLAMFSRQMKNVEPLLVAWIIASVCLEFYPSSTLRQLFIVDYSAYFIAGAACFLIWRDGPTFFRLALLVGSFALALFEANREVDEFEIHYQTVTSYAVTDLIIGAFFIAMYLIAMRWTGSLGRQTWFIAGALTYPFYLIHQNIGYLVFNTFFDRVNAHVLFWGTLALMLTASYCIFVFVDRPLRPRLRDASNRLLRKVTALAGRQLGEAK